MRRAAPQPADVAGPAPALPPRPARPPGAVASGHRRTGVASAVGALSLIALIGVVAGCGGHRGEGHTVTVSGRAVDGPLQGATACLDTDDDGRCGSDEPRSAPTDTEGRFSLAVPAERAGRHAVVVEVPAEAIDADTGAPVGRAFTLRTPATGAGTAGARSVFVSPLTTLVAAEMRASGVALPEATERVRRALALNLSPLADFVQAGATPRAGMEAAEAAKAAAVAADAERAARLARLVQLTALAQAEALAPALAALGDARDAATLEMERSLLLALPALASALDEALLPAPRGAELEAGLASLASALAGRIGPDATELRWATTSRRLAEPVPPAVPVATGSLRTFSYTSPQAWQLRTFRSSAADNVPDANGWLRYHDVFQASTPGTVTPEGVQYAWNGNGNRDRAGDLHWNGSAWVTCQLTGRYGTQQRDALGRGDYDFCGGREAGTSVRRIEDVSGQPMRNVVEDRIRSLNASYANWGPGDLNLYGTAVFPAGSLLWYQNNVPASTAYQYDPRTVSQVSAYSAAVAAGGDARTNAALACNDPQQTATAALTPVTSLEDLVARNPGSPCRFNPGGTAPDVSGAANDWWSNSTVNIGDRPGLNTLPAGTGNYYNSTAAIRVAFTGGTSRGIAYYRCFRRASDGSIRNCTLLGRGRYTIQTLGDARVMSLSLPPALAQPLGYARVFVERGGRVYFGFKSPVGVASPSVNLNLTAANAVLRQLGLPRIQPVTQPGTATGARAATLQTLQGTWGGATGTEANVWRFGADGRFFMAEAKPFLAQTREQSGAELGWFDHDPATGRITTLLEVDSNLTSGTSHPSEAEAAQAWTITANSIAAGTGGGSLARLPDNAAGLVGMWAIGSPTDLAAPHFVFFGNGRAMVITHDSLCEAGIPANECAPGVEYASYTFDAATGTLTINNPLYDTNGCHGVFNSCPSAVAGGTANTSATFIVTLAGNGLTAALNNPDGTFEDTLYRVAPSGLTAGGESVPGAGANTLVVTGGESYPLRANFTINAAGQITGGAYDFHKLAGTMTPCTIPPTDPLICFGTNGVFNTTSQGGALGINGAANATTLRAGPDGFGYTFTGTLTGTTWSGTWTKTATSVANNTASGSFSVVVVISQTP